MGFIDTSKLDLENTPSNIDWRESVGANNHYMLGDGILSIEPVRAMDTLITGIETQPFESWQQRAMERYEARLRGEAELHHLFNEST